MRDRPGRRVLATARVRVLLDIAANGAWGPECTSEQIQRQAAREVLDLLRSGNPHVGPKLQHRATVVGEPEVTMIFTTEDT